MDRPAFARAGRALGLLLARASDPQWLDHRRNPNMTTTPGLQAAQEAARKAGPGYEQMKSATPTGARAGAIAVQPDGVRKALAAEGFTSERINKAIGSKGR